MSYTPYWSCHSVELALHSSISNEPQDTPDFKLHAGASTSWFALLWINIFQSLSHCWWEFGCLEPHPLACKNIVPVTLMSFATNLCWLLVILGILRAKGFKSSTSKVTHYYKPNISTGKFWLADHNISSQILQNYWCLCCVKTLISNQKQKHKKPCKIQNSLCNIYEQYWLELGLPAYYKYKVSAIQGVIYGAETFWSFWICIQKKKVTRIVINFYFYVCAYADLLVATVALLIVAGNEILYVNCVADSLVLLLPGC